MAPVLTLVVYAIQAKLRGQDGLDTNTAFTSIAIITYVTQPVNIVISMLPALLSSLTGFDRVQAYLLNPPHQDRRVLIGAGAGFSKYDDREDSPVQNRALAIEIQEASIRPAPDAELVLKGINVSIDQGSLVFCAGAVGTGKTTLAKAILGEISPDYGAVSVSSASIAYCAQSAWLMNGTVQQLICGPPGSGAVDQQWYQKVVYACDLKDDIQRMPQGDQTVIGSGGIVLSGGQRQRVVSTSLAWLLRFSTNQARLLLVRYIQSSASWYLTMFSVLWMLRPSPVSLTDCWERMDFFAVSG